MLAKLTPLNPISGDPLTNDIVMDPIDLVGQPLHFQLDLESARGIPRDRCTDVFVRYKMPHGIITKSTDPIEEWTETKIVKKCTLNPEFKFSKIYKINSVTREQIKLLRSSAIKFETKAKLNNDIMRPNTARRKASSSGSRPGTGSLGTSRLGTESLGSSRPSTGYTSGFDA
jgi:hypothetical protein